MAAQRKWKKVEEHEHIASNFIVRNALNYMEENYKEKILLSDVAEENVCQPVASE